MGEWRGLHALSRYDESLKLFRNVDDSNSQLSKQLFNKEDLFVSSKGHEIVYYVYCTYLL